MKHVWLSLSLLALTAAKAQTSWNIGLNSLSAESSPNFGTSSNHGINFFTNNTQKMQLTSNGILKINGLSDASSRFLFSDNGGNLVGSSLHYVNGNLSTEPGMKLGINTG